ncbi:hypothetical protein DXG03_006776 [Asterophora parasitica]|uniref:ATPase domain-containing protein n=1 Tax=Asterophora parasitica TaxID=117018 RepID=A0A9P7GAH2_9AGAR|nr:hypothetical protein DXG03_006776 [Asterophora parasitica]
MPSIHWMFRSNIPRRRNSFLPPDIHKRNFFGMGEIIGVITKPGETVRSLTESKRLLEEARREIEENRERSQLRPKHTFSRLPGFFSRSAEIQVLGRTLEGEPSFTVLLGASSTGKTALLREVLCHERYHVLHFDLRIAGFADLASLYQSLSQQMELYFEEIAKKMPGYEEFEKEAWSFKFDRQNVEQRIAEQSTESKVRQVKTSDIARLMELFQSSLLKYWEFKPFEEEENHNDSGRRHSSDATSDVTHVNPGATGTASSKSKRWTFRRVSKQKGRESLNLPRTSNAETGLESEPKKEKPPKKMPVIFFDEAHKLPALIQSTEAMKCLLDSMLVLTKQDRLCHVIHATSDPFYQTWLRQFNVMQHCKIITIGDCSRSETKAFYREQMLPGLPERLRHGLRFESLYEAFGGKLAHWRDYVTDYVNSNGKIDIKQSSHFLQAHALLNLHIIHSSQSPEAQEAATTAAAASTSNAETLHPGLGPAGFKIYSPITHPHGPGGEFPDNDRTNAMVAGYYSADFTAMQLLKVMSRLTQPDTMYLPYFLLCRELGVRAVDGMVKGRLLDLRWTETVTKENAGEESGTRRSGVSAIFPGGYQAGMGTNMSEAPSYAPPGMDPAAVSMVQQTSEEGMVPVSENELRQRDEYEDVMEVVGPKLFPVTPIMRYAMQDVVQEYEDDQSVSEYASLSDVDYPHEY